MNFQSIMECDDANIATNILIANLSSAINNRSKLITAP